VTPGFLVGAGRAREVARIMLCVAGASVALSLVLTPELGLEGPAIGTAVPFVLAFPLMLRLGLGASGARLTDVLGRAYLPAWVLGATLALGLVLVRLALEPRTAVAVLALAGAGLALYWLAYFRLVLSAEERAFARGLLSRRG
jgi:O-antigen/teichoic acid export membrane protein